jgi:hypothetical protein
MFERFTEKARRVIFFARYEASQYGSPEIATEHFLLGLMREDPLLVRRFLGPTKANVDFRAEIEKSVTRGKMISTSVEIPLSVECKRLINLAGEEAERLSQREVGTEHLLLALLGIKGSLAAKLLAGFGLNVDEIRGHLAVAPQNIAGDRVGRASEEGIGVLRSFLTGLDSLSPEELLTFFGESAEFIDSSGKCWSRGEMSREFEALFAHYAKKNAAYVIGSTPAKTSRVVVANVVWKNALAASEGRAWMHRMNVVLTATGSFGAWEIVSAQVTEVRIS